ncbi:MAG: hypothetical protein EHM57_05545 [Actinobacteria bacterium]|nr:MAG: hypothetical protein EHM57_05545 [Actinomycetota bacterium]
MPKTMLRTLAALTLSVAVQGCGGSDGETPVTETSDATPSTTTTISTTSGGGDPTIPAGFPIPVPEGGTVMSSYPTEVMVGYAESDFGDLVDFYRDYSEGRDGVETELFDGGFEWQIVSDRGGHIVITVTPEDAGSVVLIRLL